MWRTGSNRATHIEFGAKVLFENIEIPKGTYTLFTIPNSDEWHLLLNKETGQWGTYYDKSQEILRLPMKIINLNETREELEILVQEITDEGEINSQMGQCRSESKIHR